MLAKCKHKSCTAPLCLEGFKEPPGTGALLSHVKPMPWWGSPGGLDLLVLSPLPDLGRL